MSARRPRGFTACCCTIHQPLTDAAHYTMATIVPPSAGKSTMTMESVSLPYNKAELRNPDVVLNMHYLSLLEDEARRMAVFDHPFLIRLSKGVYTEKALRFAFIQF